MANQTKLEEARAVLAQYDAVRIRINTIMERGLELHEKIWTDEEAFWEDVRKHPDKFKARLVSFQTFFSRFAGNRTAPPPDSGARRRVTPEELEAAGLTDDQIEKLATVNEENDDNDST
jgi:hypothetical protein